MSGQAIVSVLALIFAFPRSVAAQSSGSCGTDRTMSTLVGAGLGGAIAAIPATIVHRHDQTSSHLIVAVSIPTGALIGFVAAGHDRPCLSRTESPHLGDAVVATRSSHAGHGAFAGILAGGLLGAAGGTFYNVGCERDTCNATTERANVMLFSAGEGAIAGAILGGLIGWAWPVGR